MSGIVMCCSQHRDVSSAYGCDENLKVRKAHSVFFLQLFLLALVLLVNIKARCKKFLPSVTIFFFVGTMLHLLTQLTLDACK